MSTTQPALAFEQADTVTAPDRPTQPPRRRRKTGAERPNWSGTVILFLCSVTVLLPLYVTISMSLKTTGQAVDGNAFSLPAPFSFAGFSRQSFTKVSCTTSRARSRSPVNRAAYRTSGRSYVSSACRTHAACAGLPSAIASSVTGPYS